MWSERLSSQLEAAGATVRRTSSVGEFDAVLESVDAVVVDLTARAYDPIVAISKASARGKSVISVGPHEALDLRKQALEAGAARVYSYARLFSDGARVLGEWLAQRP